MPIKAKEKIKLQLEVLDLSDVDNKLLVVKVDRQQTQQELHELQMTFFEVLQDMKKTVRVAFVPQDMDICIDCKRSKEIEERLKNEEDRELIKGSNNR